VSDLRHFLSESVNDVKYHRECLFVKFSKIHEMGVKQCDLRPENIAVNDNLEPYLLDFTHSRLHECEGPSCEELVRARKFLLLDA
jgi:serine/threonine protein kinase